MSDVIPFQIVERFKLIYDHVDDIDLFIGMTYLKNFDFILLNCKLFHYCIRRYQ